MAGLMEFDFNKFIYILSWVVAVVASLMSMIGAATLYYYNNTTAGQLELLSMRIRKQGTPEFRWSILFIAVIAWIAVACF